MSRTHKDKPHEIMYPEDSVWFDCIKLDSDNIWNGWIQVPGKRTKKRRNYCHFRWYGTTPSWWTRMTMNRPQRRKGRVWERVVLNSTDIELQDPPGVGRKPHVYYY